SSLANTITGRRLNAYNALACSNSAVTSRVLPAASTVSANAGDTITLGVINIDCAQPAGAVSVTVNPGNQTIVLQDDGLAADQAAGDGIYSGAFAAIASNYTLTFPDGDVVTVLVGNATYDSALKAPKCSAPDSYCDSGTLLVGRDTMYAGAEPH